MEGNVIDRMTRGIDESAVVIICITRNYVDKVSGIFGPGDSCKREFEYADSRKGGRMLLPVVMERELCRQSEWTGAVGFVMSKSMYVDLSDDSSAVWLQQVKQIVDRVRGLVR